MSLNDVANKRKALTEMLLCDLKKLCKEKGCAQSGKKEDLVEKLMHPAANQKKHAGRGGGNSCGGADKVPHKPESARLAALDKLPKLVGAGSDGARGFGFSKGTRYQMRYETHQERTWCETQDLINEGRWAEASKSLEAWCDCRGSMIGGDEMRQYSKFERQIKNKSKLDDDECDY